MNRKSSTRTASPNAPAHTRPAAPQNGAAGGEERRWQYVRAVYPLNPGIPHFLDFPRVEA